MIHGVISHKARVRVQSAVLLDIPRFRVFHGLGFIGFREFRVYSLGFIGFRV